MQSIQPHEILQRWNVVQYELLPELKQEFGGFSPRLEKLIHILEWVRIEEFISGAPFGSVGRPQSERAWLANAFVAKAMLNMNTTSDLIERLMMDRALRRICGFPLHKRLPSESTFSRAFNEFTQSQLAQRVHETLIESALGDRLIGHLSRDGTAIPARERPRRADSGAAGDTPQPTGPQSDLAVDAPLVEATEPSPSPRRRRKGTSGAGADSGEAVVAQGSPIKRQRTQSLAQMLKEIPTHCDRGTKSNAQGYKTSWNGYKLHIDTADCGVPVSALLSSASMHDSRAAIPLSLISKERVTNLYDVMDAAYCSFDLHEHCRELNHVPLIDHNPRGGEKEHFEPADAVRYRERSVAERSNARLKDEFGGRHITVKGGDKVMSHLMFGVLALSADQLMRLRI
jgi:hypothetical protein